jgi:hypothetical protein
LDGQGVSGGLRVGIHFAQVVIKVTASLLLKAGETFELRETLVLIRKKQFGPKSARVID